jgi:hypothetical protein
MVNAFSIAKVRLLVSKQSTGICEPAKRMALRFTPFLPKHV